MRSLYLAVLATAVLLPACDDMGGASGARGPCASSGEILACDEPVETADDACWRLVECGVFPVDHADDNGPDWGRCMARLDRYEEAARDAAIACIGASSCDALTVNDSPHNPYEWPDCLELQ